jgi:uncharacterized protein (TIGR02246 family)
MPDRITNSRTFNAHRTESFGTRTMREVVAYVTLVSLAVFTMSAPSIAQTDKAGRPDTQQAVTAFVTKYLDTFNKKDASGLATLYTEDGVLVPPGPIATGRQSIEKAWRATFDAGRTGLKYKIQQIQADGNLIWSVGQFTVMAPDEKGILQERQGNFANIYQWEGNELKFRVHAFNFLPVPPPGKP